jgi:polyphosphate kinase
MENRELDHLRFKYKTAVEQCVNCYSGRRRSGRLIFKMNALEDGLIIKLLNQASQARVSVDLIVHGACCLRPQMPGVSENILEINMLGCFMAHGRIYYFRDNGAEECYLGNADLMPCNLNRRVEVLFTVEQPQWIKRLKDECLHDEIGTRRMYKDGSYSPEPCGAG